LALSYCPDSISGERHEQCVVSNLGDESSADDSAPTSIHLGRHGSSGNPLPIGVTVSHQLQLDGHLLAFERIK
jgi:hypothetical protein